MFSGIVPRMEPKLSAGASGFSRTCFAGPEFPGDRWSDVLSCCSVGKWCCLMKSSAYSNVFIRILNRPDFGFPALQMMQSCGANICSHSGEQ